MFIEMPPDTDKIEDLRQWCARLHSRILLEDLHASATWDANSIAIGDKEAKDITVTGAALGDYAMASLSIDVADLVLNAQVTAANTVTCVLANNTDAAVDLASATVYVRVLKRVT